MTGVEGRPELIVEGSMDGEEWRVRRHGLYQCNLSSFSIVGV